MKRAARAAHLLERAMSQDNAMSTFKGLRPKYSVLDQAADRDGTDMAGCRKGLRQSEADIDQ